MKKSTLTFPQLMAIYNHVGEEERHFNIIELEYRKLASQWLLVSLGAIGYVITEKESMIPIDVWILVIAICLAACVGIFILWMLDIKVYHQLLHAAFKEGVLLENEHPEILPQIRNNMLASQTGGDIIKRVILYYFFSILLLLSIANISVWMMDSIYTFHRIGMNITSVFISVAIYKIMIAKSDRVIEERKI